MSLIKENIGQENWFTDNISNFIPVDHISRFVVDIVEESYDEYPDLLQAEKPGRPAYSNKTLLKILFLC
jgi:transposase